MIADIDMPINNISPFMFRYIIESNKKKHIIKNGANALNKIFILSSSFII